MSRLDLTYRPINVWPGDLTVNRKTSPFDASWASTKELLDREIAMLQGRRSARDVVLQLAVPEGAIRQDGQLASGRKAPDHPGVILSFDTPDGPLRFSCDTFQTRTWRPTLDGWQVNLRAIALGLEALRKVQRYGLGTGREQYAGYQALPPGGAMAMPGAMSRDEAARFLADAANEAFGDEWADADMFLHADDAEEIIRGAYRDAVKVHHPDAGGDPAVFRRLTDARDLLIGAST